MSYDTGNDHYHDSGDIYGVSREDHAHTQYDVHGLDGTLLDLRNITDGIRSDLNGLQDEAEGAVAELRKDIAALQALYISKRSEPQHAHHPGDVGGLNAEFHELRYLIDGLRADMNVLHQELHDVVRLLHREIRETTKKRKGNRS